MKFACQYAIIRFMPFIETGEFANVGIVLFCPETGNFCFQISDNKTRKINSFFSPIPGRIYPNGIKEINEELLRIEKLIRETHQKDRYFAAKLFHELVREREATFRFSKIRGVLADDMKQKADELFTYYVERGFVTREYTERLDQKIRHILSNIGVRRAYKRMDFKDKRVSIRIPFTYVNDEGKAIKAIKPLQIFESDTSQSVGDGWSLLGRMSTVRTALPDNVLVACETPDINDGYGWEFFHDLEERFRKIDIQFIGASDEDKISNFAKIQ